MHSVNLTVTNSVFGSGCNGLNFGSETVGDFTDVLWENITVTHAGKAGIGIVTMDGAHISNVVYRNISIQGACVMTPPAAHTHRQNGDATTECTTTMCAYVHKRTHARVNNCTPLFVSITRSHITQLITLCTLCTRYDSYTHVVLRRYTPFYLFVGDRLRRPDNATAPPGSITDITIEGVEVTHGGFGAKGNVTSTANGLPANGTTPEFVVRRTHPPQSFLWPLEASDGFQHS